jgi:iron complex transport system permease protein
MHFDDGQVPEEYTRYIGRKIAVILAGMGALTALLVAGIAMGPVSISPVDVVLTLAGRSVSERLDIIVLNIRLPQALSAVAAGAGLAVSGAVMQSILRNPLGSPFTLGLSHAAAFGAALAVMVMGTGTMSSSSVGAISISSPYATTAVAFAFCLLNAGVIIAVSKLRQVTAEVMILTGIALGSLFTAGTMFLQYFADDTQLAAMVFWTFGDTARASWRQLAIISVATVLLALYFQYNSWSYNAIDAGDETARGLGVRVDRVRVLGMLATSLLTSVIVSFLGIIGFVGLVCPHLVRRLIGSDMRFLIPASLIAGAVLLLASDTAARLLLSPHVLPVSVLTAFLGAPVFIALIIRGGRP